MLIDTAQQLLQRAEPRPSSERFDQAVEEAIGECLAAGLTGIHEMGVELYVLASYRRLVERGRFPFRNYAAIAARSATTWTHYREQGPEAIGDARVVVRALKLMADGALGSRGAALHDSYCDDPGNAGLVLMPPEEITRLTLEAAARGFQVCVHAIGDRANTLTLDALEAALERAPWPDHRFRVEHAQVLTERDIPRFHRLGALPSMQARGPTRGARCSPPVSSSLAARTFPSRARARSTASTRRSRGAREAARIAAGSRSSG